MTAVHDDAFAEHRALLYGDPDRFLRGVGAFVRDGVREGDHVLVALTSDKTAWLREELGGDADGVDVADASDLYSRQGPMFTAITDYLARHAAPGGGRARIVAEHPLRSLSPPDVRAYMRYEAAFNVALAGHAASVLCPYDAQRLPEAVLQDAMRTHPEILEHDRAQHSALYTDPRVFVRGRVAAPPVPPGAPSRLLDRPEDVAAVRELVRAQAAATGLATQALEDLAVAVSEVAANALLHGAAPRRVWSYLEDGAIVCRVRDAGLGLPDPLAGYLPPDPRELNGRGLWLANQLCDVVEVTCDGSGTDVYLRMYVPA